MPERLGVQAQHAVFEPVTDHKRRRKRKDGDVKPRKVFLSLAWEVPETMRDSEVMYKVQVASDDKSDWKVLHLGDETGAVLLGLTGSNYVDCKYTFRVTCEEFPSGKKVTEEVEHHFLFAPALSQALNNTEGQPQPQRESPPSPFSPETSKLKASDTAEEQATDSKRKKKLKEEVVEIIEKSDAQVLNSLRMALDVQMDPLEAITWCPNTHHEEVFMEKRKAMKRKQSIEACRRSSKMTALPQMDTPPSQVSELRFKRERFTPHVPRLSGVHKRSTEDKEHTEDNKRGREGEGMKEPKASSLRSPRPPAAKQHNRKVSSSCPTPRKVAPKVETPIASAPRRMSRFRQKEMQMITRMSTKVVEEVYAMGQPDSYTVAPVTISLDDEEESKARAPSEVVKTLGRKWTKTRALRDRRVSVAGWLVSEFGMNGTAPHLQHKTKSKHASSKPAVPSHIVKNPVLQLTHQNYLDLIESMLIKTHPK